MPLKTATPDEATVIYNEVKKWFESSPASTHFSDAAAIAVVAVAEYIANSRGLTLYGGNQS